MRKWSYWQHKQFSCGPNYSTNIEKVFGCLSLIYFRLIYCFELVFKWTPCAFIGGWASERGREIWLKHEAERIERDAGHDFWQQGRTLFHTLHRREKRLKPTALLHAACPPCFTTESGTYSRGHRGGPENATDTNLVCIPMLASVSTGGLILTRKDFTWLSV